MTEVVTCVEIVTTVEGGQVVEQRSYFDGKSEAMGEIIEDAGVEKLIAEKLIAERLDIDWP
jgi:hypothetical protein